MKKYLYILLLPCVLGSCLKGGLDDYPVFDEAKITDFDLEYRYVEINNSGVEQLVVITLNSTINIDENSGTITVDASIPKPTESFSVSQRAKVNLNDIVAYTKLSPAAKIEPLNGAPTLGVPGDFSQPRTYLVTAADGITTKEWTIKINPLPLINEYEGFYQESGTLVRTGNPADNLDAVIYLETEDINTVRAQAAKSVFNNSGITYFIRVNTDNTITILSDPNAVVDVMPQAGKTSTYDPATKTFDLHYHYRNGDRLFDTKLVKIE